jgi:hypothetical protein
MSDRVLDCLRWVVARPRVSPSNVSAHKDDDIWPFNPLLLRNLKNPTGEEHSDLWLTMKA